MFKLNEWTEQEDREEGFSLVELLVVIVIIGIITAIAIAAFLNQRKKAFDATAAADLDTIRTATVSELVDRPNAVITRVNQEDTELELVGTPTQGAVEQVSLSTVHLSDGVIAGAGADTAVSQTYKLATIHKSGTKCFIWSSSDGTTRSFKRGTPECEVVLAGGAPNTQNSGNPDNNDPDENDEDTNADGGSDTGSGSGTGGDGSNGSGSNGSGSNGGGSAGGDENDTGDDGTGGSGSDDLDDDDSAYSIFDREARKALRDGQALGDANNPNTDSFTVGSDVGETSLYFWDHNKQHGITTIQDDFTSEDVFFTYHTYKGEFIEITAIHRNGDYCFIKETPTSEITTMSDEDCSYTRQFVFY